MELGNDHVEREGDKRQRLKLFINSLYKPIHFIIQLLDNHVSLIKTITDVCTIGIDSWCYKDRDGYVEWLE